MYAPVAQLDRALPSEGKGQRFESSRVHHSLYPRYFKIWVRQNLSDTDPGSRSRSSRTQQYAAAARSIFPAHILNYRRYSGS